MSPLWLGLNRGVFRGFDLILVECGFIGSYGVDICLSELVTCVIYVFTVICFYLTKQIGRYYLFYIFAVEVVELGLKGDPGSSYLKPLPS